MSIFDPRTQSCSIDGFSGAVHDAFGRLRVSQPETLFDSKQLVDNQPLFWDDQEVSGSGTSSSHSAATASTTMSVGATTAGKRVRQTFQRFNYQPGKSQLILMTGQIDAVGTGVTASMGIFDDDNGIFVSNDEGTLSVTIRSSTSGSAVDNTITQDNWNGDKLDGTGDSGITLDATAAQIFWIDFEWLGVGSVRCGFVIDGVFILFHTFHHANTVTSVYMSNPNLPLRYEIENDGTGAATSMQHICSTIMSEGGEDQLGYTHWISTEGAHIDLPTENTLYAVMGLRLKSTWQDVITHLREIEINEQSGNKIYEWVLLWEPTVAGTFTYSSVDADTAFERALGSSSNTVTGGHKILGGFATSAVKGGSDRLAINTALRAGAYIDGTSTTLVLCVRPVGGSTNIDIEAGINFQQLV